MNTKIIIYPLFSLIIILLIGSTKSCVDDNFDFEKLSMHTENEGNWGIPLVKTTFLVKDLLDMVDTTGFIETDDDGMVMIIYTDTAYSKIAEEEIVFPDKEDYDTLFNYQDYVSQGWDMEKKRVAYEFAAISNFQVLDSILFKSAEMHVNVTSTFKYTGTLTITIPELTKDGETYQKEISIDKDNGNFTFSRVFDDINNYKLDFSNFNKPNSYLISYNLTLNSIPGEEPQTGSICDIDIDMRNIKYDYVWGYIGKQEIGVPETNQYIDVFNELDYGEFHLKNPKIKVKIINSFGIPVDVYMRKFQFKTGISDKWIDVTGSDISTEETPWELPVPEPSYPEPLEPEATTIEITGEGSNLDTIISKLPNNMRFSEMAIINPDNDNSVRNFMSAKSRVEAIMELKIPLWGRTTGISFADTMDLDLNMEEDNEIIDSVNLTIRVANGLPHSLGLKCYLLDSAYEVVDTIPNANDTPSDTLILVESGVLEPADSDDNYIDQETGKTESITNIKYQNEEIEKLEDIKYIRFKIKFLTTDGQNGDNAPHVKYFEDYGMDFNVSADIKLNVNENL